MSAAELSITFRPEEAQKPKSVPFKKESVSRDVKLPSVSYLLLLRLARKFLERDETDWLIKVRMLCYVSVAAVALNFSAMQGMSPSLPRGHHPVALLKTIVITPMPRSHLAVAHYIAHRFHVSTKIAKTITQEAYQAAKANHIKPSIVLAVAAVESGYHAKAVNSASGARGLMQILPDWHRRLVRRVGGTRALLKIRPNLQVGARILATYLHRSQGKLTDALWSYCGHVGYHHYLRKVRAQLRRIKLIMKTAELRSR